MDSIDQPAVSDRGDRSEKTDQPCPQEGSLQFVEMQMLGTQMRSLSSGRRNLLAGRSGLGQRALASRGSALTSQGREKFLDRGSSQESRANLLIFEQAHQTAHDRQIFRHLVQGRADDEQQMDALSGLLEKHAVAAAANRDHDLFDLRGAGVRESDPVTQGRGAEFFAGEDRVAELRASPIRSGWPASKPATVEMASTRCSPPGPV